MNIHCPKDIGLETSRPNCFVTSNNCLECWNNALQQRDRKIASIDTKKLLDNIVAILEETATKSKDVYTDSFRLRSEKVINTNDFLEAIDKIKKLGDYNV